MPSISLLLIWLVIGLAAGALTLAAHLKPTNWQRHSQLWLLLLTTTSALAGGLLGFYLFGRAFATATALWVAILVPFVFWLIPRLRRYSQRSTTDTKSTTTGDTA